MKTCPKCGAENLPTANSCRMCAVPLEAHLDVNADALRGDKIPASVLASGGNSPSEQAPASSQGTHIVCQSCKAVNESDYVFCEQCGARLTRPVPPTADRPAPTPVPPPSQSHPSPAVSDARASLPVRSDGAALKEAPASGFPVRQTGESQSDRRAVTAEREIERFDHDRKPDARPPGEHENEAAFSRRVAQGQSPIKVACENCGNSQPTGGLYCGICGSVLSPSGTHPRPIGPSKRGAFLELITEATDERETYPVKGEVVLGRVEGDVTFSHDGYMSGRHARIVEREGRYFLVDEGSRNGTFIRIEGEVEIHNGDVFLIGKQVLRFERE